MLARVHVAGQRWRDAISALDEAASCGVSVPPPLRRAVEDHLQAERSAAEEQREARTAREQGEVRALRTEARRLRSEQVQLTGRATDLEREVRKWAWATVGVSTLSGVFLLASMLFGGGAAEATPTPEAIATAETEELLAEENLPEGVQVEADRVEMAKDPIAANVAAKAAQALSNAPELEETALELKVKDNQAVLGGEVERFTQMRAAEDLLKKVDGIDEVDASGVVILARTRGASYTVRSGDTLSHIARRHYGDRSLTKPIEKANKVSSKNLRVGQDLTIPPVE